MSVYWFHQPKAGHLAKGKGPVAANEPARTNTMNSDKNTPEAVTRQANPNDGHAAPWDDPEGYDLWEAERAAANANLHPIFQEALVPFLNPMGRKAQL